MIGSVALARRCGFLEVGVYGRLDGEWKELPIAERLLAAAAQNP